MLTSQMLWIIFAVFVLGLFLGSNLGVMLMCVLYMSGKKGAEGTELVTATVPTQG